MNRQFQTVGPGDSAEFINGGVSRQVCHLKKEAQALLVAIRIEKEL